MPTSVAPQHVFSVIFVRLLCADVEWTTENDFMLSSISLQFITIQLTLYEFEHLLCWSSNLLLRALGDGSSRFERCSHYARTMPDQLRSIVFRERFEGKYLEMNLSVTRLNWIQKLFSIYSIWASRTICLCVDSVSWFELLNCFGKIFSHFFWHDSASLSLLMKTILMCLALAGVVWSFPFAIHTRPHKPGEYHGYGAAFSA